ncbi:MAG: YciI-like protein [Bacteroidia bacterium]|nr:YciI-like protein [Bacteroidia bacterium]
MYHILFYTTADDYLERRAPYREEHLAYARAAFDRGELIMAGALADPADSAVLVFKSDSPQAARNFAMGDVYVRKGVVISWDVRPWTVVVGGDH